MRCARCMKIVYRWQVVYRAGAAHCPFCQSRICALCGCTEERACRGGCAWRFDDPAICSQHELGASPRRKVA